jgi:hypothetical protein
MIDPINTSYTDTGELIKPPDKLEWPDNCEKED